MDCKQLILFMIVIGYNSKQYWYGKCFAVPQYILLVQGIKITNLITKVCDKNNKFQHFKHMILIIKKVLKEQLFLDPVVRNTTGMYLDQPIAVVDYANYLLLKTTGT